VRGEGVSLPHRVHDAVAVGEAPHMQVFVPSWRC